MPYPGRVSTTGDEQLGRIGRTWRVVLVAVLAVLFVLGSTVGDDHWWPFAPWRMFSTSTNPNRAVVSTVMEVRTDAHPDVWNRHAIRLRDVGLNRAEIEGRLARIREDPTMLATIAEAHERLRPERSRWLGIRFVFERHLLEGGKPTGEITREVVATWESDGLESLP